LDEEISADSAGTGHWHVGEPPHHGTKRLLQGKGIAYEGLARLITESDLEEFDYIVTMDEMNFRDVLALGPARGKLVRLSDFAPESGLREVPDPYYDGRFETVYEMVEEGARNLLAAIRRERNL
jgi:protein-tyrosine phosphatase